MRSRFYLVGGVGIVALVVSGVLSGLGVFVGVENLFKQKEDRVAVVKEEEVPIHAGPNKDEPVKAVLEKGEQVHVIIKKGAWLKVNNKEDDELGWIRENTVVWSRSPKGEEKGSS